MRPRHSVRRHKCLALTVTAILVFIGAPLLSTAPFAEVRGPGGLPHGLKPVERNLSSQTGLEHLVFGESQIAVNPKNPNNIVYVSLTHRFTQACTADPSHPDHPFCEEVPRFIPGVGPIGSAPLGFFEVPQFVHNTAFVTLNKGKTWKAVRLPDQPFAQCAECDVQGDPSITVTPNGTFVFIFDAINWGVPQAALPNGGIGASVSKDGGLTWSTTVLTKTALDGPKVISDPNTGRIYEHSSGAVGTRLATGNPADPVFPPPTPNDRYVAASSDGKTWTQPQRFGADTFPAQGGLAAAHGVIATVTRLTSAPACALFVSGPAPCVVFSTSNNDGATWVRKAVPAADLNPPAGVPPGGGGILIAADPTKPGRFAIAGYRPIAAGGGFAVYRTPDSGATWDGPTFVNDDNPFDKTRAALAYSLDGTLGLMWRAFTSGPRPTPPPCQICAPFTVWATISDDGGATFEKPIQVSSEASPSPPPGFHDNADHYSSITFATSSHHTWLMKLIGHFDDPQFVRFLREAFGADRLYVSWADSRPAERAAYIGEIKLQAFRRKSGKHDEH